MAKQPEFVARDEETGRDLYLLEVEFAEQLPRLAELRHFACLLVWDAPEAAVDQVCRVVEPLLEDGCLYFNTAGSDCERVHDIIDETIVGDGSGDEPLSDHFVMTSWHNGKPLEDTLYFFLRCSLFADPEEPSGNGAVECRAAVALLIGQAKELAAQVRGALAEPEAFVENFLATDPDE